MNISRFKELVILRDCDYKKTYKYVDKNFIFINKLVVGLVEYLGCDFKNVSFIGSSLKEKVSVGNLYHDLITGDDDCFFNFKLLITIHNPADTFPGFNVNNCGKSFAEKHLIPPSGLFLNMAIKQENNLFTIKALDFQENKVIHKSFNNLNPESEEPLIEVFEFLFQSMKKRLELGLEGRINALKHGEKNSEAPFGFVWQ